MNGLLWKLMSQALVDPDDQLRTLHLLLQAEAKSITCTEVFTTLVITTILTLNSCNSLRA